MDHGNPRMCSSLAAARRRRWRPPWRSARWEREGYASSSSRRSRSSGTGRSQWPSRSRSARSGTSTSPSWPQKQERQLSPTRRRLGRRGSPHRLHRVRRCRFVFDATHRLRRRARPAVDGALTFRGPADAGGSSISSRRSASGGLRSRSQPGSRLEPPRLRARPSDGGLARGARNGPMKLALVTPEVEPLHLFGDEPSAAVRALLEERGIAVHTQSYPAEAREGELLLVGGDVLPADRVVALPRLQGQRIGGVAQTFEGSSRSIRTDGSSARPTSMRPATSRRSPSSKAALRPSRRKPPPSRSRPRLASGSSRGRSGRCSGACSSRATDRNISTAS